MGKFKQVIALREDLDISRGKQISQACHASLSAYKKANGEAQASWEERGCKKVIVDISDEELVERFERAKGLQIPAALVKDAGHTEVKPGTKTALGLGPAEEDKIDKVTGDLKLVK